MAYSFYCFDMPYVEIREQKVNFGGTIRDYFKNGSKDFCLSSVLQIQISTKTFQYNVKFYQEIIFGISAMCNHKRNILEKLSFFHMCILLYI